MTGFSTMREAEFGDKGIIGGTGPLWGCSALVIITKRGTYTSHNWQIPNFSPGHMNLPDGFYDQNTEFHNGVEKFLEEGTGDEENSFLGIRQLKERTHIFDNIPKDTLKILIFTGSSTAGIPFRRKPTTEKFDILALDKVNRWKEWIVRLGFPSDKIEIFAYNKGPKYWPKFDEHPDNHETKMTMAYKHPDSMMMWWSSETLDGLVHWHYHPNHLTSSGTRQPTIRVWYERFLMFEESWCLPGTGSVAARQNGGSGSCPMPPRSSKPAQSASASASASNSAATSKASGISTKESAVSHTSNPTVSTSSQDSKTTSSGPGTSGPKSSSSVAVPSAIPGPGDGKSFNRVVNIDQEVYYKEYEKIAKHTATIEILEITQHKKEPLISAKDMKNNGPVDLPHELNIIDQTGSQLKINFLLEMGHNVEFQAKRKNKLTSWSLTNASAPVWLDRDKPWCEMTRLKVDANKKQLSRSNTCWYST
ncbi:hypothetical protein CkaCkLH20_11434 [Colletotrichum karsti]|uniref:Uncharacterized protein n=1 Tax=Colletotrichum karsti TaxID=1095194 RepID=A0A9P6HU25_9PEZI|nr:uncharacterized protein CkaCkLH20_11434 [Colletotrichum karsti]KAF9871017.1 hypothetical protein CkaCkLH20_11434 [Colletotrichum karsti]